MSIYRVIDKLEAYVHEGTWVPLGHRILSEERLIEFIEKMRSTLPEEVGRAKVIASNKDRIVRDAQEKAQAIVSEAFAQKNELVEQQDVMRTARQTADVVLREAEEKARRIRAGADAYAAQMLADLEGRLATALGSVQKGREALAPKPAAPEAAVPAGNGVPEAAAKSKRAAFDAAETPVRETVEAQR